MTTTSDDRIATTNEAEPPRTAVRCVAWCPDDCGVEDAREYDPTGCKPSQIAELHVESVYWEMDEKREEYQVRVRATEGEVTREWEVTVDVETAVSFHGMFARRIRAGVPVDQMDATADGTEAK